MKFNHPPHMYCSKCGIKLYVRFFIRDGGKLFCRPCFIKDQGIDVWNFRYVVPKIPSWR